MNRVEELTDQQLSEIIAGRLAADGDEDDPLGPAIAAH
jgi:hypothetical protein